MSQLSRHTLTTIALSFAGTLSPLAAAETPAVVETPADVPLESVPLPDAPIEPVQPVAAAPSQNVTVNLISRLVQKGILTQEEATILIQQAENDAAQAQALAAAAEAAPKPLDPLGDDEVRVNYVPETVRKQMRDEISRELMAQAREEKWGENNNPDWVSKFRLFGDFRGRYEGVYFGDRNNPGVGYDNYNAINNGAPFDYSRANVNRPPSRNVDEDRNRARIRARVGTDILLGEGFNAGLRLGTGESNSPTSPNQTLGGSGGNFSKYSIWLDRAFLSYDAGPGNDDGEELTFFAGRFDNPFLSTEIQWDDDIGFDGLAMRGKVHLTDAVSTFFTAGYFPIYNTDFNFSSNQDYKTSSNDRWLTGAQIGIDWKIRDDLNAKVALSYYDFNAIEGEFSTPYIPQTANDSGDTDHTRTSFTQSGNTMMILRRILQDEVLNDSGNSKQFQYFGLASEFRNLTLNGRLDYDYSPEVQFALVGELIKNVGFDESEVAERAYANGFPGRTLDSSPDQFEGGDLAWNLSFQVGKTAMDKRGDWLAMLGYRYVESDSVVDGFTDSDFGGGGTNVKGFTLGGSYALSSSVKIGARWLSSDEVDGAPLSSDTLQFDLNARF